MRKDKSVPLDRSLVFVGLGWLVEEGDEGAKKEWKEKEKEKEEGSVPKGMGVQ